MNIIFGRDHAELLKERYTVLEIVNLDDPATDYQCFCIVDGDIIPKTELPTLAHYQNLHSTLVDNLRRQDKNVCGELVKILYGRWGGELDTFYQAIVDHYK